MKNHKQLLADFYLELLAIPATDIFRLTHQSLYAEVRTVLAIELDSDAQTVQRIFERMAREDANDNVCPECHNKKFNCNCNQKVQNAKV